MKLKHLYHWYRLRQRSAPDRQFRRALWQKLDQAYAREFPPSVSRLRYRVWRLSIAMLSGLITVGSVGTAAYAYNSPAVTEGSPLYTIKRNIEKVEEKLQRTPAQKVAFDLKKIQRREAEAVTLLSKQTNTDRQLDQQKVAHLEVEITADEDQLQAHTEQLSKESSRDERLQARATARLAQRQAQVEKRLRKKEDKINKRREQKEEDNQAQDNHLVAIPTSTISVSAQTNNTLFSTSTLDLRHGRRNKQADFAIIEAVSTSTSSTLIGTTQPETRQEKKIKVRQLRLELLHQQRLRHQKNSNESDN